MMSTLYKYKLPLVVLATFCILVASFYWSNIPMKGNKSPTPPKSVQLGYFSQVQGELGDWTKQFGDISYFAASDQLLQNQLEAQKSQFYPVYDGSTTDSLFNQEYPHVPSATLPGYGKTVYSISNDNAKLFFLNARRLSDAEDVQLEWLKETVDRSNQAFAFAWLSEDPKRPEIWSAFRSAGISAVFIGNSVFTLEKSVEVEPSNYTPTEYDGWRVWDLSAVKEASFLTIIDVSKNKLSIKVENQQGDVLDRLEQNTINLDSFEHKQEIPLVGIQSVWSYHPGSKEIITTIPEGYDVTGEGPIIETFPSEIVKLPSDDWRSPEYDDSDWKIGRAPFGYTNVGERKSYIETNVEAGKSPTYYFRKSFELNGNPEDWSGLSLNIAYEDGYVVYLNGQAVSRDAIETGLLSDSSLAFANDFNFYRRIDLKAHLNKLVQGTNVVAVEVHRSHPSAPNLFFDLGLSIESNREER
ncbi:hypothetical protein [Cohnella lupini]|uniref:Uncharacterized protein n=1 Tax=Cohnella lupini TaxID=1294267 RepID=A0A3D9I0P4_9BACL|nr:hypothetical protein [Cohnella lupini]RED55303.1 hypothetical protein DFP95_11838 [Cohnella lupini]